MKHPRNIELAPQGETERRSREIQILVNIIEPDPEYQAFLITDEASALDVCGASPEQIQARLEFYFRRPLPVRITVPLCQLVDSLKSAFPGWPDDWSPEDH
jgi:hypothetical protein